MRTTCSLTALTAILLLMIATPGFAQRAGSGDQPAWWPVQHSGPAHPDSISGGGVHTASTRASARDGAEKAARDDMTSWLYYRSLRAFQRDHIGTSLVGLERRVPVEEEKAVLLSVCREEADSASVVSIYERSGRGEYTCYVRVGVDARGVGRRLSRALTARLPEHATDRARTDREWHDLLMQEMGQRDRIDHLNIAQLRRGVWREETLRFLDDLERSGMSHEGVVAAVRNLDEAFKQRRAFYQEKLSELERLREEQEEMQALLSDALTNQDVADVSAAPVISAASAVPVTAGTLAGEETTFELVPGVQMKFVWIVNRHQPLRC